MERRSSRRPPLDRSPQLQRGRDQSLNSSSDHPARNSNLRFYSGAQRQYQQGESSSDTLSQPEESEEIFHLELDGHGQQPLSPVRDKPMIQARDIAQSDSWKSEEVQTQLKQLHKSLGDRRWVRIELIEDVLDVYYDQMYKNREQDIDEKVKVAYYALKKIYIGNKSQKV